MLDKAIIHTIPKLSISKAPIVPVLRSEAGMKITPELFQCDINDLNGPFRSKTLLFTCINLFLNGFRDYISLMKLFIEAKK